jgi:glycosyltransferase involved in cell wall biosynthesis
MKKFSVIVPFYNAEPTIERVLASFISNRDFIKEVILVNDRSTDKTLDKIDNFKCFYDIKVIDNQGNKGPGPARKTGLLAAEGEWITFVDADDALTPSSLYYVNKRIEENPKAILIFTQSMFHETGQLESKTIDFSDYSGGGNFYKREYLITNKLFPHDELFMVEDEYFTNITEKHINLYGNPKEMIYRYEYPTYNVHHDWDERLSFAYSNWTQYICKYRLQFTQYYSEFFESDIENRDSLKEETLNNLIYCYCLYLSLKANEQELPFDEDEALETFYNTIQYIMKTYDLSQDQVADYFYQNPSTVHNIYKATFESVGFKFTKSFSFKSFIKYVNSKYERN